MNKREWLWKMSINTVVPGVQGKPHMLLNVRSAQNDKANAQQINALTAKVGNAESTVSQVSSAFAGLNGKVSSMHTIKTQAIAGGRTAVAGIALGANHEESSVIVMADKFGIVANANDGNVKPVFSVADGQVGIRGDLVVAGSVTRDKLSSGGGGNLLDNPIFANNAYGWGENRGNGALARQTTSLVRRMSSKFSGLVTNSSVIIAESKANSAVSSWWHVAIQTVSVVPGHRYCFSAYVDAWACTGELMIQEIASDGKSWVRDFAFSGKKGRSIAGYTQSGVLKEGSGSIQSSTRSHVFFTAPRSGYVSVTCVMRDIKSTSVLKIAMPMLEECTENTIEPSPWQNAGVTEVHGGSIIADTIRGDHIQANQEIRAPRITGGVITGNTVNGATVNGGTVNGTVVNGSIVKGSTIEGGVIKAARLEGVTGKFTGTLEVNQLVGGNLCEVFVANISISSLGSANDKTNFYTTTIHINPSPVKRIIFIVNSDINFVVNANERKDYYYSKTSKGDHPPEVFGFNSTNPKICVTAYAVSDTKTIYQ